MRLGVCYRGFATLQGARCRTNLAQGYGDSTAFVLLVPLSCGLFFLQASPKTSQRGLTLRERVALPESMNRRRPPRRFATFLNTNKSHNLAACVHTAQRHGVHRAQGRIKPG